jgi:hypothetical protein
MDMCVLGLFFYKIEKKERRVSVKELIKKEFYFFFDQKMRKFDYSFFLLIFPRFFAAEKKI